MANKQKLTVGVIGCGRIGKIHTENLLRRIPNVIVKRIADVQVDLVRPWAEELGVAALLTQNYRDIFDDKEIRAVIICSPTDTHAQMIQEAAIAKKDIFCEKPIDFDLARIHKTLHIVKENGVKLMIGFNRRFDRNMSRVRDHVRRGNIGIPHIVKITSRDPAPPPMEYIKVSGGLFFDMAIHDFDMARFLTGEDVVEVFATGEVLVDPEIGKAGDIDTAVTILKFTSGAMAVIDNSRKAVYGYDQRVEVFGSKGCASIENEPSNTAKLFSDQETAQDKMPYFFLERYKDSYATELAAFVESVLTNQQPPVDGVDGLKAVLLAMAAQMSLVQKKPIRLDSIDKN